jgi:hypothetical protein
LSAELEMAAACDFDIPSFAINDSYTAGFLIDGPWSAPPGGVSV